MYIKETQGQKEIALILTQPLIWLTTDWVTWPHSRSRATHESQSELQMWLLHSGKEPHPCHYEEIRFKYIQPSIFYFIHWWVVLGWSEPVLLGQRWGHPGQVSSRPAGMRLKFLWRIHADTGRTCKLHIERPFLKERFKPRTDASHRRLTATSLAKRARFRPTLACTDSEMQGAEADKVHWSSLRFLVNNELIYTDLQWAAVAVDCTRSKLVLPGALSVAVVFEQQHFSFSG